MLMKTMISVAALTASAVLSGPAFAGAALSEGAGWQVHINPDTGAIVVPESTQSKTAGIASREAVLKPLPQRAPAKLPSGQSNVRPGPKGGVLVTPPAYMQADAWVHVNAQGELVEGKNNND